MNKRATTIAAAEAKAQGAEAPSADAKTSVTEMLEEAFKLRNAARSPITLTKFEGQLQNQEIMAEAKDAICTPHPMVFLIDSHFL